MPVPNGSEKVIKIHRDSNYNPQWPPQQSSTGSNQQQQESRTWSTQTVTKRVVSSNASEPVVTQHTTSSKSSDLFSNAHANDRRGSSPVSPIPPSSSSRNNTQTSMRSSSLVRNALNGFEDVTGREHVTSPPPPPNPRNSSPSFNQNQQSSSTRRDSKTTTYTSQQTIPASTPSMEIVPSGGGGQLSPTWSMGTDAGGDVPVTYEIVTKADGKKEFQLLLTANQFSPEDLEVKLTDNVLNISGKHEERSPNGAYSQKSFYRSCTIPSGVRPEDLNCSLDSCGRLKITAPVPDPEKPAYSTTKTITTTQQHRDWHNDGVVPSGFKVGPGAKEQVITVWNDNSGGKHGGSNVTKREEHQTVKTVRTYKTVS